MDMRKSGNKKGKIVKNIKQFFLYFLLIIFIYISIEWITLPDVSFLEKENPSKTALMKQRQWEHWLRFQSYEFKHKWVAYSKISPVLRRAVIVSEDASFYSHEGFDYEEIQKALKRSWEKKKFPRGASTITQQLAKNLFLSTSKNPIRKIKEVLITQRLEKDLSKRRILEIYLNSVEWGEALFGCEAASRFYFRKSCSNLSTWEAAQLTACLPNPRYANPKTNTRQFRWRTRLIYRRLQSIGF